MADAPQAMNDSNADEQRLDKWLWCARLFKTRTLASDAIKNGRVTVNDTRAKPSRAVQPGDSVVVEKPPFRYALSVLGVTNQRVSASRVAELYRETTDSIDARAELAIQLKASRVLDERQYGKLTKKERRDRERLKRDY